MSHSRRELLQSLAAMPVALALGSCGGGGDGATLTPGPPARSWRLGFSPNPPVPTAQAVLQGIDLWSQRAEFAMIHEELPWTDLLGGMTPAAILTRDKVQLVSYLRSKGLTLLFMADPTDGLSRADEAPQLRALGRSLAEPAVQQAYRDYVLAVSSMLQPAYLGLAAETNLIRAAAPGALYSAVVQAANAAAGDLLAAGSAAIPFTSVQLETAWGVLGAGGSFQGITRDLSDFAFSQLLGYSSYPYLAYSTPEDIPHDYYSRIAAGQPRPVMVVEGGWTSANVGTVASSPAIQARYVTRHADLLDSVSAKGLIQLVFADIDTSALPPPIPVNLPLFTQIGLCTSNFTPKPALAAWDALHARVLRG